MWSFVGYAQQLPPKESERGKWKYTHTLTRIHLWCFLGLCVSEGLILVGTKLGFNSNWNSNWKEKQLRPPNWLLVSTVACHTQAAQISPDSRLSAVRNPHSGIRIAGQWYRYLVYMLNRHRRMANAGGENSALDWSYHSTGDADRRQFAWRPGRSELGSKNTHYECDNRQRTVGSCEFWVTNVMHWAKYR